jgi:hypothetical protein
MFYLSIYDSFITSGNDLCLRSQYFSINIEEPYIEESILKNSIFSICIENIDRGSSIPNTPLLSCISGPSKRSTFPFKIRQRSCIGWLRSALISRTVRSRDHCAKTKRATH